MLDTTPITIAITRLISTGTTDAGGVVAGPAGRDGRRGEARSAPALGYAMSRKDQLLRILAALDGHFAADDCSPADADRWRKYSSHCASVRREPCQTPSMYMS
jgi:hypothetical protein